MDIKNVKKEKVMEWDTYFMSVALLSSFRSKDGHMQNGACIVGKGNTIIGMGYNGLPRGLNDENKNYWNDDDKSILNSRHTYVVHAEKNAIYNSTNQDLENSTLYTTFYPCNICAQAIIQVGIKKVIYLRKKENTQNHLDRNKVVKNMFKECNVEFIGFDSLKLEDSNFLKELENSNSKVY
jgi:dCMP deaminase